MFATYLRKPKVFYKFLKYDVYTLKCEVTLKFPHSNMLTI